MDKSTQNRYNFVVGLGENAAHREGDILKYNKTVYQALMMITQFGVNMLVPIFLCSFLGMFLDRKFGTSVWMVGLFFVGSLAGFTNVFRFARKIYETPAKTRRRSTETIKNDEEKNRSDLG